jgi:BirA family biotin operon repressor/biotin-[acetyl-CoA-carboxylase] ligase
LAVGVALADAIEPEPRGRRRIGLKWPNDLWLMDSAAEGRKLGGALIETVGLGERRRIVIGIGLNVVGDLQPAGGAFASGCAGSREIDPALDAPALLARVAPALLRALHRFDANGFAAFAESFAARDLLAGRAVETTQADLPVGVAEGVGADGSLRLRGPDGRVHEISSGEVSVRPRAGATPSAGVEPSGGDVASSAAAVVNPGVTAPARPQAVSRRSSPSSSC